MPPAAISTQQDFRDKSTGSICIGEALLVGFVIVSARLSAARSSPFQFERPAGSVAR